MYKRDPKKDTVRKCRPGAKFDFGVCLNHYVDMFTPKTKSEPNR